MSTAPETTISPRPIVRFGGRTEPIVQATLQGLELEDSRGGLATLEVRLVNRSNLRGVENPFDSDQIIRIGQSVFLGMGDEANPISMFRGVVTAIEEVYGEGPPQVVVLAEDILQKLRMKRRTKVHEDFSVSTFVSDVTRGLEVQPRIDGFSEPLGLQVQLNESDLGFLRRVLADHDGEIQLIENEFHVRKVKDVRRGTLDLHVIEDFQRCRITADLAHQVTEVTVTGWDPVQGSRIGKTARPEDTGPGTGKTGAQMLQQAHLGPRSEHVAHVPVADDTEAEALAKTAARQRARGFVFLEGTAYGDPRIRVGAHINLLGTGQRFRNTFVVTRTCHRYVQAGDDGYVTDFEAECAFLKESR